MSFVSRSLHAPLKEKVGSVKPLFPLVGPNRHLFRLGPRTISANASLPIFFLLPFLSNLSLWELNEISVIEVTEM